ncbi:MAG: NAD(P)-binding domain-containing protein [Deltaproteobacteria bacterium]|nr:NAD(P)-binding domain-containing protein [Deltaproteobacteria bacterium]
MSPHVSVLGAGPFGATIAWIIGEHGRDVRLWSSNKTKRTRLRKTRKPPGTPITLGDHVEVVDTIDEAMEAGLVFIAVPPAHFRSVMKVAAPLMRAEHRIIHTVKGLEPGSGKALSTVISEETRCLQTGVLAGPVVPHEIWRGDAMSAVVGSQYRAVAVEAAAVLISPKLRVYGSLDLVGVEVAGAMRTPLGLAAGMLHEMGLGRATKAFLLTRTLAEAAQLSESLGGNAATVSGLAGIGDWMVTAEDMNAPVVQAGMRLAKGEDCAHPEAAARVHTLIELADRRKLELPITRAVGAVLQGTPVQEALAGLMSRRMSFES